MKKILVLISNYGENQSFFCQKMIDELKMCKKYFFDIKVFSSKNIKYEECENIQINNRIGHDFPNSLYDFLRNHDLTKYSHILFTENDLFFSEINFDTYFKYETYLLEEYSSIGFLRYEQKNGDKFLIDCGYDNNKISFSEKRGIVEFTTNNMFRTENCHQGCWFLNSKHVQKILNLVNIGPTLEDKASNFYYSESWPGNKNGIKKFIPFCDFEKLLIHHQPNKYVGIYDNLPSVSELITQRNEYIICN
jgi:hypothetical protein